MNPTPPGGVCGPISRPKVPPPVPAPPADPDVLDAPDPALDVDNEESPIEEAAREKLGLRRYDCPALFRETADAATDTDLPFWMVLMLSGAIATLGLLLNQTAVVIGAMLVAPLLGPLLGLSLALAVGDGRLAAQTGLTIVLGAAGVIALAAGLTYVLPFQGLNEEILARTEPTTLDLGIAVFSGLAGAVVTVSREKRLSASIPGVAIAVALIPPLGVAGFAIGTGRWQLLEGPLLLFGANLGGIVLSGMGAFLLVGMHRNDVLEAARRWHRNADLPGLAGRIDRSASLANLRVFESPSARVALVLAFVAAVAVPLSSTLDQVLLDNRVRQAVDAAIVDIEADGDASVLSRDDDDVGPGGGPVRLRVATTGWIGEDERERVERVLTGAAGVPITLTLEQLVASDGNFDAIAERFPTAEAPPSAPAPAPPSALVGQLQEQVPPVLAGLTLPGGARALGAEVAVGGGPARVVVAYATPRPPSADANDMVAAQAAAAFGLDRSTVGAEPVVTGGRALPADSLALADLAALVARHPALRLTVVADSVEVLDVRGRLVRAGAPAGRVTARTGAPRGARLTVAGS